MDFILNRYRNLTVLVVAILAQLVLLAYQVKSNGEVRLIRVWAVSAVTPLARLIEGGRSSVSHFVHDYFILLDVREQNERLKTDVDRLNLENQYLRSELSTAERARSLAIFQQTTQSKTIAAHVISNTTSSNARVVIVDRGSVNGIQKEMAVITPDGIVGKVTSVYPTASFVRLITDPSFAAGVISQKNRVHGTLRGQGHSTLLVDHVQDEENVEQGEWFFTSGDDLIFPKGLRVGQVNVVKPGKGKKEVFLVPSGLQNGLEAVLIITDGVHQPVPELVETHQPVHIQAAPEQDGTTADPNSKPLQNGPVATDADRITDRYRRLGENQNHVYGAAGGRAPDYNAPEPAAPPKVVTPPKPPASAGTEKQ